MRGGACEDGHREAGKDHLLTQLALVLQGLCMLKHAMPEGPGTATARVRGGACEDEPHEAGDVDLLPRLAFMHWCASVSMQWPQPGCKGGAREDELHEAGDGDLLAQLALVGHQRWLRIELRGVLGAQGVVRVQVAIVEGA